jgi:hypothetical protein
MSTKQSPGELCREAGHFFLSGNTATQNRCAPRQTNESTKNLTHHHPLTKDLDV